MSSGAETSDLLATVEPFSGLEPRELHQVAQVAVPRSYDRGELIFREGDAGDTCYAVRAGPLASSGSTWTGAR